MTNFGRRILCLAMLGFALASILAERSATAQTGNWEYVPALGGYLDWDTGLVWGEHSSNVILFYPGWDYVNTRYLPDYRTLTGIPNWRMPTVAESQVAVAHGIVDIVNPRNPFIYCWTSESKSKGWAKSAHYAVSLISGEAALFTNKSTEAFIPVYRAFTP